MLKKNLGQVFTPEWVVKLMLAGYDLEKQTILEPACGDGAFLKEIVQKILDLPISNKQKVHILETQIEGFEIDKEVYDICLSNLDELVYPLKVRWQIHNTDTLKYDFKDKKYSLIIGNPPYVRLHNLSDEYRVFLKNNFSFCKGTTDLYAAFYEKCLRLLNEDGELVFITPNTFLKNISFKNFREYIFKNCSLKEIKDFKSSPIFSASTYCAIMTLTSHIQDSFCYREYDNDKELFSITKPISALNAPKWIFTSPENEKLILNRPKNEFDINIQYGLATLRDKIFITSDYKNLDDELCLFNGHLIEKDLIKPIIKGSRVCRIKKQEYCLFPYHKVKDKIVPFTVEELKAEYPNTYIYFLRHKNELLKRDMDKSYTSWFQFGRSQGIQNMLNPKLIIDPIVGNRIISDLAEENTLIYSGIFITGKDLKTVQDLLSDETFIKYVRIFGKDMQNNYKSLTTKMIKEYLNI